MRRLLPSVALAGALGFASLAATACDASPYAATVNGHTITESTLNAQLRQWSSNRAWVTSFESNSQSSGGGGATTVRGNGGAATYSAQFASDILGNLVDYTVLHQHLVATGQLPTQDEIVASRAVNEYLRSDYWGQFPANLRQFLVEQLADQAVLTPVASDQTTLDQPFQLIQPYLFSKLCVVEASAFSASDAQTLASSGDLTGATICYDQPTLEDQPAGFRDTVMKLSLGQVSKPIKTGFGFEVVQLVSRETPGKSDGVKRVLSVATASSEPAAIGDLISKASVKVNPAYGTWSQGQIRPPQPASS